MSLKNQHNVASSGLRETYLLPIKEFKSAYASPTIFSVMERLFSDSKKIASVARKASWLYR
jgi:hypothetical protein